MDRPISKEAANQMGINRSGRALRGIMTIGVDPEGRFNHLESMIDRAIFRISGAAPAYGPESGLALTVEPRLYDPIDDGTIVGKCVPGVNGSIRLRGRLK